MVELADEALGRGGKLTEAIESTTASPEFAIRN
jgi:hypothetical protein